MKTCEHTHSLQLQRYHDGEAAGDFGAHLVACAECRAALAELRAIGDDLRRTCDETPRSELASRVVQRARDLQARASRRVAWGLMAAASALFVSSLFLVGYSRGEGTGLPARIAQWEERVLAAPALDEEHPEADASMSLYAIHLQRSAPGDDAND